MNKEKINKFKIKFLSYFYFSKFLKIPFQKLIQDKTKIKSNLSLNTIKFFKAIQKGDLILVKYLLKQNHSLLFFLDKVIYNFVRI